MKKDLLQNLICVLLVFALAIGVGGVLQQSERTVPDNPITGNVKTLSAEVMTGSGKLKGEYSTGNEDEDDAKADENPVETPEQPPETSPEPTPEPTPEQSPAPTPETTPEPQEEPIQSPQPTSNPDDSDNEPDPSTPPTTEVEEGGEGDSGGQDGDDDSGANDSGETGVGDSGGDDNGGQTGGESGIGDGEADDEPKIYTDLYENMYLARSELPDGELHFQAHPVGKGNLSLKVIIQNKNTPANGTTLYSSNDNDYIAQLSLNSDSYVTIYLKENGENLTYARFKISYYENMADDNHPEVGDYPPRIITSLDGESHDISTQDYVFWVKATTHSALGAKTIYSNQIKVWLDGDEVEKHSGDSRPEYDLHFPLPNVGADEEHIVKVLAWDGSGNSTYKYYVINFHHVEEGERSGQVTVIIDATAAGLGIIDIGTVDFASGESYASVIIKFLQNYGYDATYDGSATYAFYLRRIYRADLGRGAGIPADLRTLLERDGIVINGSSSRDSLGEFDFTMGSGWMYSVNGVVYPGRGMSEYPAQNGSTVYLRFTLAYGKDIAGYDATGGGMGNLSGYCKVWIGGTVQNLEHDFQEVERVEPTESEDGYIEFICSRCHEEKHEVLPAIGESTEPSEQPEETETPEPSPEETDAPDVPPEEPEEPQEGTPAQTEGQAPPAQENDHPEEQIEPTVPVGGNENGDPE